MKLPRIDSFKDILALLFIIIVIVLAFEGFVWLVMQMLDANIGQGTIGIGTD